MKHCVTTHIYCKKTLTTKKNVFCNFTVQKIYINVNWQKLKMGEVKIAL